MSGAEQVGSRGHREEFGFYARCSLIMLRTGDSRRKLETIRRLIQEARRGIDS